MLLLDIRVTEKKTGFPLRTVRFNQIHNYVTNLFHEFHNICSSRMLKHVIYVYWNNHFLGLISQVCLFKQDYRPLIEKLLKKSERKGKKSVQKGKTFTKSARFYLININLAQEEEKFDFPRKGGGGGGQNSLLLF